MFKISNFSLFVNYYYLTVGNKLLQFKYNYNIYNVLKFTTKSHDTEQK